MDNIKKNTVDRITLDKYCVEGDVHGAVTLLKRCGGGGSGRGEVIVVVSVVFVAAAGGRDRDVGDGLEKWRQRPE